MSMFGDARSTFKSLVHGNYKSLDEDSLVWPPMLFVCMHEDDFLTTESEYLRRWLVNKKQIDIVKHIPRVCSEGYAVWDLFILPPTGAAFAAALEMDEWTFMEAGYRCVYASVRDIWDIKAGRIPERSRRDLSLLRYCGMAREEWVGLHVELLGDDGTCVGQGVCQASQPQDYFHDAILGDSHVGVSITTSEGLEAVDGSSSAINRRWKSTHVLFEDVSLSQRLDQYVKSQDPHEREQWSGCRPVAASWCRRARLTRRCRVRNVWNRWFPWCAGQRFVTHLQAILDSLRFAQTLPAPRIISLTLRIHSEYCTEIYLQLVSIHDQVKVVGSNSSRYMIREVESAKSWDFEEKINVLIWRQWASSPWLHYSPLHLSSSQLDSVRLLSSSSRFVGFQVNGFASILWFVTTNSPKLFSDTPP